MKKQTIQISGTMLSPLVVGKPAHIREDNGSYRHTTNIQRMEQVSQDEVRFETHNTFYVLKIISSGSCGMEVLPS